MSNEQIKDEVEQLIRSKDIFADIEATDDFFEQGASSLTVVNLQFEIEKKVGVEIETPKLLASPTIEGWSQLYSESSLSQAS